MDKIFEHFVNFILLFISTTEQCSQKEWTTTMDNNGQQWTTMDNNGQQWTIMENNGQDWTPMDKIG